MSHPADPAVGTAGPDAPPAPSPPAPSPRRGIGSAVRERATDLGFYAEWAALIGLVVLVVVFQAINPIFLSSGNVEAVLTASAILVVLSVGQTFVITTGGIDLSVASVMTFAAIASALAYRHGSGLAVACVVAVAAGAAFGAVNGLLVSVGRVTDFIATLGTLSAASGLALILADGRPITVIDPTLLKLTSGGVSVFGWSFVIAAVIALAAHVVYFRTRFGTHVLAVGGSVEAAAASGVRTGRVKFAVYTLAGALAGIGSILLVARVGAGEPAANTAYLLNSVAAVVLGGVSLVGGRGRIAGPVLGALLLTALTNGLTLLGVSQFYQPLSVGIVVVLAALLARFQR